MSRNQKPGRQKRGERLQVADHLEVAGGAIDSVEKMGQGAQRVLEESGLWETLTEWFKDHPAPVTAAAMAAVPFATPLLSFLPAVLAYILWRNAKKKRIADAAERQVFETETREGIKDIKEALRTAPDPTDSHAWARMLEKIDALVNLTAKKGDFDAMWKHFDGLLWLNREQMNRIEAKIANAPTPADFTAAMQSELDSIRAELTAIKSDTAAVRVNQASEAEANQRRHRELMGSIESLTTMLTGALQDKERGQAHVAALQTQIDTLLAERERLLATGNIHEGLLDQALAFFAENKLADARNLYESVVEPVDEIFVRVHAGLGDIAMREFNYSEAEIQYRKACASQDNDVKLLRKLLHSLSCGGKLNEAVTMAERIRDLLSGHTQDPEVLDNMSDLAATYSATGRHEDALEIEEEVLATHAEALGERHPKTLQSANNLAETYWDMGWHADAMRLHGEVLTTRREVLGARHPDTLSSMNNFAATCLALGRHAEALTLLQEVLAVRLEALDHRDPDTLSSMNNLAQVYQELGRYEDALKLHEDVLAARKEVLGDRHPDTLMGMNNLAQTYRELDLLEDAMKLHEEVLAARKEVLGNRHPDTLSGMNNLALVYQEMGRYEDALKLHEEVLAVSKEVLGDRHPDTLMGMNNLAQTYRELDLLEDAMKLHEEVLAASLEVLGDRHPNTLRTKNNLASTYQALKRYDEAADLFSDALAGCEAEFDLEHPLTQIVRDNRDECRHEMGI